jgi:myo-inositol 2-dehydrogenase/D-chiro-inositol 1-dehydrogenase
MAQSDPVRFGLIGTGRIGVAHAANIAVSPHAELVRVVDANVERAQAVAGRFGAEALASAEELLRSGDIDAVLVASPTPTHADLIEACVDAGLPVLCEKPIDLEISRVDRLRAKVASSSVPVALGFNQRFDPAIAEVKARLVAGEIGTLEHLAIVSRDPGPPPADYIATSGGIFRDMTIHDFDMVRFFLGDIVEVFASGSCLFDDGARQHGDFDTVAVTLRSASGAIATLVNSRHSAVGYDQRLEAFGAGGLLQVCNPLAGLVSASTAAATEARSPYIWSFLDRYAASYARELEEFIRSVRGEASSSPTYEDGRAALLLADAARRSAAEGVAIRL